MPCYGCLLATSSSEPSSLGERLEPEPGFVTCRASPGGIERVASNVGFGPKADVLHVVLWIPALRGAKGFAFPLAIASASSMGISSLASLMSCTRPSNSAPSEIDSF